MAENKTVPTAVDPRDAVAAVTNPTRRRDAERLLELLGQVTGEPAVMWGPSIIGFGSYDYRYASGRTGRSAAVGFSPRASATVLYLADGVGAHATSLARLGPHKQGTGCLYVKDLDAVDLGVLEEIVRASYATVTAGTYGLRAGES